MNNNNNNKVTIIIFFSFLMMSFPVHADKRASVKDVLQWTLETNPAIKAELSKEEASREVIKQRKAGYYPKLDFRGGAGYEITKNKFSETNLSSQSPAPGKKDTEKRWRTDPGLTLTQNIFDANKTNTDVCKAASVYLQSRMKTQETIELELFSAVNAAVDLRRYQRLLKLSKENVAEHERILKQVNALIDGGRAPVSDRQTVESRLHDAKAAVIDVEADYDSAMARFIEVVGREPGQLARTEIKDALLPKTEKEALREAIESNYSVMLARSRVKVEKAELKAAEVPFYPDLKLEIAGKRDENTEARRGSQYNLIAQAVVRYNLFNGFQDVSRQREVTRLIAEQRHRLEKVIRTAQREVRVSWTERKSARAQEEEFRASVQAKEDVLNTFHQQFEIGKRNLLDLLDAANELFLAKGSLITVDATADLTAFRMLTSMGKLRETLGFQPPQVTINEPEIHKVNDYFMQDSTVVKERKS